MGKKTTGIIIALVSIALCGGLAWWLHTDPTADFTESTAGMDNRGKGNAVEENISIGEFFKQFFNTGKSSVKENWPQFRGSDFDNISKTEIPLIDKFKNGKPDTLWSVDFGEGHAGAAIYEGLAYVLDYDEEQRADMLRCFELTSGKEVWRRWYKVNVKRNHGMSRTVPAVTNDYILTIGPRCHVMCVRRSDGEFLWGIDIEKDYESEVPLWYTGQCPLIDNGVAILAPGGKAMMMGVDCKTGQKLWEVPNKHGWKMSHSSVLPYTYEGVKMYVYSAVGGILAVSAEEGSEGEVLWQTKAWNHSVVAPSPVCMPDGKIFLTAGYGAGSMMLQLKKEGDKFSTEVLQEYKPSKGLACEQQTAIYANNLLFGIMPKDGGTLRNQLVCVSPDDATNIIWSSGKEARFGLGPFMLADNKLFVLNDDATLYIIKFSTSQYIELDKVKLFEGHDAWAPLALADGYMLLRDSKKMVCINLRK
ncbi:MAG: PQQ-binding-like beta-propeller repeat protein [Bacteroidales bacterium]|nr:PQQ-binding-like beta-propeller repeat protein [Bacteroidales bacterium]